MKSFSDLRQDIQEKTALRRAGRKLVKIVGPSIASSGISALGAGAGAAAAMATGNPSMVPHAMKAGLALGPLSSATMRSIQLRRWIKDAPARKAAKKAKEATKVNHSVAKANSVRDDLQEMMALPSMTAMLKQKLPPKKSKIDRATAKRKELWASTKERIRQQWPNATQHHHDIDEAAIRYLRERYSIANDNDAPRRPKVDKNNPSPNKPLGVDRLSNRLAGNKTLRSIGHIAHKIGAPIHKVLHVAQKAGEAGVKPIRNTGRKLRASGILPKGRNPFKRFNANSPEVRRKHAHYKKLRTDLSNYNKRIAQDNAKRKQKIEQLRGQSRPNWKAIGRHRGAIHKANAKSDMLSKKLTKVGRKRTPSGIIASRLRRAATAHHTIGPVAHWLPARELAASAITAAAGPVAGVSSYLAMKGAEYARVGAHVVRANSLNTTAKKLDARADRNKPAKK